MIPVSSAYKELVKSNIRPKCEPIIKVSGVDNNGNDIELVWNAKNIKDLNYRRSIDPVGRELPYMELTWTEIYTGKLNAESYPEKYNNIVKYMQVELFFVQDLSFYNTWKSIFRSGTTWKDLLSKTWKRVKNETTQEIIGMPKMFLSARPMVEGKTIKWVAKDVVSVSCNKNEIKEFDGTSGGISFVNPIIYFLLNARGEFLNSKGVFNSLTKSASEIAKYNFEKLKKQIIFDNSIKNNILNYCNLRNTFIDFKDNYITLNNMPFQQTDYNFSEKVIYSYPKITNGTNIAVYSFKHYNTEILVDEEYEVKANVIPMENLDASANLYEFKYKKYGKIWDEGNNRYIATEINRFLTVEQTGIEMSTRVRPVNINSFDNSINNNKVGEAYVEDNPVNPYDENSEEAKTRLAFLDNYFNSECSVLEFESLANPSIETGDVISVVTDLYSNNENGELKKITKNAVVVNIEFSYNGALKEKIIAHEVKL
jgi:hypothetical protein